MGCGQSSEGNNEAKSQEFRSLVSQRNPLAVALESHWRDFVQENQYKGQGDHGAADRLRHSRKSTVVVNSNVRQANASKLSFKEANHVASCFLGHAMLTIGQKKWGGSVRYNVKGAAGHESSMNVNGSVTFSDTRTRYTVPYDVNYSFFLCEEHSH